MLTIGQLAARVGVTVRAVRHYHQCGLLPEPERDASGYRRYGPRAVVDLIRIKTLVAAGVPLARVEQLLGAGRDEFAAAIAEIDRQMAAKIADLTDHRAQLAELVAGDRLFLPPEVIELLDRQRALGVSERMNGIERDSWIMITALAPDQVLKWAATKSAALEDPELVRLYLAMDQAWDWPADDPRLPELAEAIMDWDGRNPREDEASEGLAALMNSNSFGSSPAWARLRRLMAARSAQRP
ncbi:MerR family transcriptional regulator [Nonomuraea rubra]|uniref:helix-turn-helix domain-containing protein n=1 Tax=Nonomuraea rubra TaxID=46180 RepID=UPI0033F16397